MKAAQNTTSQDQRVHAYTAASISDHRPHARTHAALQHMAANSPRNHRQPQPVPSGQAPIQALFAIDDNGAVNDFKGLISQQDTLQDGVKKGYFPADDQENYTTVGFEHEFAQMRDGDLRGVTHLEIGESTQKLPYTGIDFKLETDAANALELVSPPMLIKTIAPTSPIPDPSEIHKADKLIKDSLTGLLPKLTDAPNTISINTLKTNFNTQVGLTFTINSVNVATENITEETQGELIRDSSKRAISSADIKNINVRISTKGSADAVTPDISSQYNFATNAQVYDQMQETNVDDGHSFTKVFDLAQEQIQTNINTRLAALHIVPSANQSLFFRAMARTLAGQLAVKSQAEQLAAKTAVAAGDHTARQEFNKISDSGHAKGKEFAFHRSMSSHVKDVGGVWIKDTLWHLGLGILTPAEWGHVYTLTNDATFVGSFDALTKKAVPGFNSAQTDYYTTTYFDTAVTSMKNAVNLLKTKSNLLSQQQQSTLNKVLNAGPDAQLDFLSHDPKHLSARQDTLLPAKKVQMDNWNSRLHVVETRGDGLATLIGLEMVKRHAAGEDKATMVGNILGWWATNEGIATANLTTDAAAIAKKAELEAHYDKLATKLNW